MSRVGRSRVSAITQTPASGPRPPVTTPPMSSGSMATAPPPCWARIVVNEMENPRTKPSKTIRRVVLITSSRLSATPATASARQVKAGGSVLPPSVAVKVSSDYHRDCHAACLDVSPRRCAADPRPRHRLRAANLQRLLRLHAAAMANSEHVQGRVQYVPRHVHEQQTREARVGYGLSRR